MADDSIADWFRSIPKITRWWFSLSVIIPILARFGILNGYWLFLSFEHVVYHFQIWRLFTSFFYFPIVPATGFIYLINLYFLYSYSIRLETGVFSGRPADYLFLLIFCGVIIIILSLLLGVGLLMLPLIMSALYVWCQMNRDTVVTFWFGIQFKAMYFPWILLIFNFILRGDFWSDVIGILAGHLYIFVMFKYPQDFGGQVLISTPQILYTYLPNEQGGVAGFGYVPQARRDQQNRRTHVWGTGTALGED